MDLLSLVLGGKVLGGQGTIVLPNLSELLIIKNGVYTPAEDIDGWDKIIVDVASDIIDVDELPTKDIEQGKIYRLTKADGTIIYGIPDEINTKTIYEHSKAEGWVEVGKMVEVAAELENYTVPTEVFTLVGSNQPIEITYKEFGRTYTAEPLFVNVAEFDPAVVLIDFQYTARADGTYLLTGWNQTKNGEPSTELIIPDNTLIVL